MKKCKFLSSTCSNCGYCRIKNIRNSNVLTARCHEIKKDDKEVEKKIKPPTVAIKTLNAVNEE